MPDHAAADALAADLTAALGLQLAEADADLEARFPGDLGGRQPVHTVYIRADQITPDIVGEWGSRAQAHLADHREILAELLTAQESDPESLLDLVEEKLAREPIEDLRIDLEDGYGNHPDREDDDARAAARALATAQQHGTTAPFHGIRFKSFEAPPGRGGADTCSSSANPRRGRLPRTPSSRPCPR